MMAVYYLSIALRRYDEILFGSAYCFNLGRRASGIGTIVKGVKVAKLRKATLVVNLSSRGKLTT